MEKFEPETDCPAPVGDKAGGSEKKFYKRFFAKADAYCRRQFEKLKAELRKENDHEDAQP